jgi:hypothetical protein
MAINPVLSAFAAHVSLAWAFEHERISLWVVKSSVFVFFASVARLADVVPAFRLGPRPRLRSNVSTIRDAKKLGEQDGYALFCDTIKLGDTWAESGVSDSTLNEWMEKYEKAAKNGVDPKIEIIDKPAAEPADPSAEASAKAETPAEEKAEPAAIAA